MKRFTQIFVMLFLVSSVGYAQDTAPQTEVKATTETVYWVDSTANNAKLLNKSKFTDNWFLGLHLGTYHTWGSNSNSAKFWTMFQPAVAISFGKMLAPAGGFRLQAAFAQHKGQLADPWKSYYYNSVGGHLDGLLSISNLILGYKESRRFNLLGVVGVGVENTFGISDYDWNDGKKYFNNDGTVSMIVRAGLMAQYRISKAWDISLEVLNTFIDDEFDSQVTNKTFDGHVNIMLGMNYRFKNHDGSRQFTYARRDMTKYEVLNKALDSLRAENAKPVEPEVIIKKEAVKSNQIRTVISFEKGVSKINRLQEVNVYTAAQALSQIKDGDLYITINEKAKGMDKDLFMARAQSIRNMLVNNFNIAAGKIFIEKNPALIDSLAPEKDCVILYINE